MKKSRLIVFRKLKAGPQVIPGRKVGSGYSQIEADGPKVSINLGYCYDVPVFRADELLNQKLAGTMVGHLVKFVAVVRSSGQEELCLDKF